MADKDRNLLTISIEENRDQARLSQYLKEAFSISAITATLKRQNLIKILKNSAIKEEPSCKALLNGPATLELASKKMWT